MRVKPLSRPICMMHADRDTALKLVCNLVEGTPDEIECLHEASSYKELSVLSSASHKTLSVLLIVSHKISWVASRTLVCISLSNANCS